MEVSIPIVTLDKIYIEEKEGIYFLDCTRINGTNEIISRRGESIDRQISRLSKIGKEIILADDVVFSGNVLKNIINRFSKEGVEVVGIISSICSIEAYNYFNSTLKCGIKTNYLMNEEVIDQICERDFYFGVAGSGIMVCNNGLFKAPYFKPYGNPNERASIPCEYVDMFSRGCLERSKYLWERIDEGRGSKTKIGELPELIIDTDVKDEVVKTLRKGIRRI